MLLPITVVRSNIPILQEQTEELRGTAIIAKVRKEPKWYRRE